MKNVLAAIAVSLAVVCCAYSQTLKPTTVAKEVSLKFGDKVISVVRLENTHSRSYTEPLFAQHRCNLTEKAAGVIWRIICEGEGISANDVVVEDEKGRKFQQTCWNSQGSVYQIDKSGKRTGGGPQTEFLAVGPDDSKKVKITFGDASAEIEMPQ